MARGKPRLLAFETKFCFDAAICSVNQERRAAFFVLHEPQGLALGRFVFRLFWISLGYAVPPKMPKRPPTGVSTADLLATREALRRRGVTGRSVNAIIAKRFNLETPTVRMRLIRHDRAAAL